MRTARLLGVVAVGLAFGLGACGVSMEAEPVVLEGSGLPADAVPDEPVAGTEEGSVVFLVAGDGLHPAPRPGRGSVAATLATLLEGPRAAEVELGLRSAVPAGTKVLGVSREGVVIRVDLSKEFTAVVGEEALLALAQVVLTVASSTSSDLVALSIDGEPVPVARGDGEVTSEPVGPDDYAELLAR